MKYEIIENFLQLAAIPRKSHHEEQVSKFLYDWACKKGLKAFRDEVGNVIIEKNASAGCENAPCTILQAHMDMVVVWEKGKKFDPLKDGITVIDDGETLRALGTSLGGDDGIGVAIAMTILEEEAAVHGPIRAIFTVDEEDGMAGADHLDAKYLDAAYLINLDWEEYGSLCCSSAGSDMYRFVRPADFQTVENMTAFHVQVQGMTGGHSGASIHHGRANAIRTAAGIILAAAQSGIPAQLASFSGGSAHNAIPSTAEAVVLVPRMDAAFFLAIADTEGKVRRSQCMDTDPTAEITVTPLESAPSAALSASSTAAYLNLMLAVHDGVNTMSTTIPSLVESSSNLGIAELTGDAMEFIVHQRSSEPAITEKMKKEYLQNADTYGFSMETLSSSPAWPVRPESHLVDLCVDAFRRLNGNDIRVEPIHAGLECGAFSQKNPSLDIISIGPDILDIHSVRETLVLESAYKCDALVRELLKVIAKE